MKRFAYYFQEAFQPHNVNPFETLKGKTLIFFDTETTGLNPYKDQIVELAYIAADASTLEVKETYNEYAILHKTDADPDILAKNHYNPNKAHKTEKEVLQDFVDAVGRHNNPIVVAHNATFDMKMVMTKIGHGNLPFNKVYDTLQFARMLFIPTLTALSDQGNEKATAMLDTITKRRKDGSLVISKNKNRMIRSDLGTLSTAIDADTSNWHNALADTQNLLDIFKAMKEYYDKEIINTPIFRKAFTHAQKQRRFMQHKPV